MNNIAKKKPVSRKTRQPEKSTGAFNLHRESAPVRTLPSGLAKSGKVANGAKLSPITRNGQDEFLISKQLKEELREFFPYPGLWLEAPHEMLGGRTPLELARTSREGKEIVLGLIQAMKAGSFS